MFLSEKVGWKAILSNHYDPSWNVLKIDVFQPNDCDRESLFFNLSQAERINVKPREV